MIFWKFMDEHRRRQVFLRVIEQCILPGKLLWDALQPFDLARVVRSVLAFISVPPIPFLREKLKSVSYRWNALARPLTRHLLNRSTIQSDFRPEVEHAL